jgi:hypothetical protein
VASLSLITIKREHDMDELRKPLGLPVVGGEIVATCYKSPRSTTMKTSVSFDWKIYFVFYGPNRRYNAATTTVRSKEVGNLICAFEEAHRSMINLRPQSFSGTYSKIVEPRTWPKLEVKAQGGRIWADFWLSSGTFQFNRSLSTQQVATCIEKLKMADAKGEQMVISLRDLVLKTRKFEGNTVEKARARAVTEISADSIFSIEVSREVQNLEVKANGKDIEEARVALSSMIPPKAFDLGELEVAQHGEKGAIEVKAYSRKEAYVQVQSQIPTGATWEVKCNIKPQSGFFGRGKKPGHWEISWTKPFHVKTSYKLPAEVTVRYA